MAKETFDSGHVIIPVSHPNGETHNIAVPGDTPLSDFHDALTEYYHPNLMSTQSQPTAQGAVENSPEFKQQSQKAWNAIRQGQEKAESSFFVGRNGEISNIEKTTNDEKTNGGHMALQKPSSGSDILVHTHPDVVNSRPSPGDIDSAKRNKMTIYVVSRDGLYAVDPGGEVSQVYSSPNALFDKKKQANVQPI